MLILDRQGWAEKCNDLSSSALERAQLCWIYICLLLLQKPREWFGPPFIWQRRYWRSDPLDINKILHRCSGPSNYHELVPWYDHKQVRFIPLNLHSVHSNLAQWRFSGQSGQTGQTSPINWSDRSKQVCQIVNWTAPLRRSRRDDRNPYIEHPIWSPDERVMPPGRPAPRSDRSDRSRAVRPVQRPVRLV